MLDAVDDEHFDRTTSGFQFETELLLHGCVDRRRIEIQIGPVEPDRLPRRGFVRREVQFEIEVAAKTGSIDDQSVDARRQPACQLRYRHPAAADEERARQAWTRERSARDLRTRGRWRRCRQSAWNRDGRARVARRAKLRSPSAVSSGELHREDWQLARFPMDLQLKPLRK